jgi:hypothetical protein
MSSTVEDIQLTIEQESVTLELVHKLNGPAFGKLNANGPAGQPQRHLVEWLLYLTEVVMEGASVRNNKKSRTAGKRKTHLKNLTKLLGRLPTDADVKELFGKDARKQTDLVALLQADVRQLEMYTPVKKNELDKLQEKLTKLHKRLNK